MLKEWLSPFFYDAKNGRCLVRGFFVAVAQLTVSLLSESKWLPYHLHDA